MPRKKTAKKDDKPKMTVQEKSKLFKLCKRKRLNATEKKSLIEQPDIVNGQGENLLHNYCKHEGMDFSLITDMVNNGHSFDNYNKINGNGPLMSCLSYCYSGKVYDKIYHMISVGCPICKDGFDFTEYFFIDCLYTPGTTHNGYYLRACELEFFNFIKYLYEEGIFETDLTKEKYKFIKPTNYFGDVREIRWFDEHFKVDWNITDINATFGLKNNIHVKDFDGKAKPIQNPLYQYIYKSIPDARYQYPNSNYNMDEELKMIEYILEKLYGDHDKCKRNYYYEFINKYLNYECSIGKILDLILNKFNSDKILLTIKRCVHRLLYINGIDNLYEIHMNDIFKQIFLVYTNNIYEGSTFSCMNRNMTRCIEHKTMKRYAEYEALQVKKNIIFALKFGYLTELPLELVRILGITYDEVVNPDKITEPFIVKNEQIRTTDNKLILTSDESTLKYNINKYIDINNAYTFPDDDEFKMKIRKLYIDANPGIEKFTRKFCEEELKKIILYSAELRRNEEKLLSKKSEIKSKGKVAKSSKSTE